MMSNAVIKKTGRKISQGEQEKSTKQRQGLYLEGRTNQYLL